MHTSRLPLRSGLTLAAAAALPAALAGPSAAVSGISVSTTGTTVSVVTSACTLINGSWGTAALLTNRQANFAQGRQLALSGTSVSQSAAWTGVSPGTYTVVVVCSSGLTAGSQSVIVSASAPASAKPAVPSTRPTISSTSGPAPSRGVMGGLGGAARDYGPLTLGVGAALVGAGVVATGWVLRRRSKPYRL
ncbi:Putative secreted protein [Streptomyces hygroscopicus subsp. limoneus]|nr:Putative secreted protein [Streptomyces hygroscopicus subsp. limoneus]